jgi:membrane protein YdbS with pleckstrin-like domain
MDDGERVEWVGEPELVSRATGLFTGLLLLPVLGLGLLILVPTYLQVKHTDYVVTNQSLYAKRGVLSTNIQSLELDRIQNTQFDQSFVEKLLNYGTVGVSTAGSHGLEMTFDAIGDAEEVRDLVRELAKDYTGRSREETADRADPVGELADELRRTREALENVDAAIAEVLARGGRGDPRGANAAGRDATGRDGDARGAGRGTRPDRGGTGDGAGSEPRSGSGGRNRNEPHREDWNGSRQEDRNGSRQEDRNEPRQEDRNEPHREDRNGSRRDDRGEGSDGEPP